MLFIYRLVGQKQGCIMSAGEKGVAMVTGVNGALGKAVVAALQDTHVVIGVDLARAEGCACDDFEPCDLSDAAALGPLIERIVTRHGAPRLLINNAAYYQAGPFLDLSAEQIDLTFAVNVRAVIVLTQLVAKRMIAAGVTGAIVNTASHAGRDGSPTIDYAASKAAVINVTRTTARELAPHGIRVNAVAPGVFRSSMSARITPENHDRMMAITPMKRIGEPEEIAAAIVFLASAQSSYITGTTIDVNGGI
jgi:3-oxoacyl-[acyl-carrier protein] reductase